MNNPKKILAVLCFFLSILIAHILQESNKTKYDAERNIPWINDFKTIRFREGLNWKEKEKVKFHSFDPDPFSPGFHTEISKNFCTFRLAGTPYPPSKYSFLCKFAWIETSKEIKKNKFVQTLCPSVKFHTFFDWYLP